jgi:hypothetical protein
MMIDDMIDFPVSDSYRDHYAAQGLTYPAGRREKPPSNSTPQTNQTISDLRQTVQTLKDQLAEIQLIQQHPHLAETDKPTPKPTTFDE